MPQFEVVLGDSTPKTGRLDQSHFSPPLTRPVFHQIIDKGALKNVSRLKLETMRVELTTFGVDLTKIKALEIRPAPNFPQRLFFDSLQLVKEK